MNYVNIILIILFNLIIYSPHFTAQPQPHTEDLKNEAVEHMKNGRYGEAIQLLNNYISARPQQAEGYTLRGLAYEYRGQFEEAVYDLRSARKLDPGNSTINENLDRVTTEWYKLIYNDIEGYKREIAINPSKPVNYLQIGKSYKNLGKWDEAEIWYDKYLSMGKASPDEIIRYTEILAKTNHIAKGEKILRSYTNEFPDDQRLWSRYGYFLLWLGKTKPAIDAFKHALDLKPYFKEALDGLARAKGEGNIYTFNDTATYRYYTYGIPKSPGYIIDIYFNRLKRNPDDNDTRIKLITELLKVKRYEEAYQQLLILKEKKGDTEEVKKLQDEVIAARDKYYKGQIADYENQLKQNPGRKDILLKLAGYYSTLGNYDKAIKLYADYLAYNPDDAEVRFLYIENAAWNGQYKLAGNELDVLILQYPDSTKYKLLRAQIYVWQDQDLNVAEKLLSDVLTKEPGNFDALLTMAMLKFQKNDLKNAYYYASLAGNINPVSSEIARLKYEINSQQGLNKQNELYLILDEARRKADAKDCYGAVRLFEKYNDLTSPDKNILIEEADAYVCSKDYDAAIKIYDKLLRWNYDYGIDKQRAKVILWSGNSLEALKEFQRLYASHPDDSEIKMYLGDAYFQLKQYTDSKRIYDELYLEYPGSKLIQTRLGWFGGEGENFFTFRLPSYFMINPEGSYYFDNFDFQYSLQGLSVEAGLNSYISIGFSGSRGEIDSSGTGLTFYTAKALLSLRFNKIFSSGLSIGKTYFDTEENILIGSAYLKADAKNYNFGVEYVSQDAAQIFYSPFLVSKRLKVDLLKFSGDYRSESGLLASGIFNYYFVSDRNSGSNLLFRLGKKFDELAAGYEFYFLGFKNYTRLYYSPGNFESHSLWGEWSIIENGEDELKIGGKVGIIPDDNFILREIFASAKFLLTRHFALLGKISTGSTVRENLGYSSTSFFASAYWTF